MKRLKYLLLIALIPLFFFHNVSALSLNYDYFSFNYWPAHGQSVNTYSGQLHYDDVTDNIHRIVRIAGSVSNVGTVPSNSNYLTVSAKFNLVTWTSAHYPNYLPIATEVPVISDVAINGTGVPFESSSLNVYTTDWECYYSAFCRTFTFEYSFIVKNPPTNINSLAFAGSFRSDGGLHTGFADGYKCYFEYDSQNKAMVDFSYDYNSALQQQQVQLQQLTINSINKVNSSIQNIINQDNKDREDLQNQSDDSQDSADNAGNSVNNAGRSLLVIIGNFINIVTNPPPSDCIINADMGNLDLGYIDLCELNLPQPLQVLSTILLIGMIIPFAYSLIMTILGLLKGATQD